MRKIVFDAAIIGLQATPSLISVPDSKSRAERRAGSIPAPAPQHNAVVLFFVSPYERETPSRNVGYPR
jgi:hypothetical protein